ncbi:hypothetical protein M0802_007363 [Mischocyttarus mexicanus]|nr:hypothetical protein M0802_007363 [Mischocyttarus mexicanus]
MHKNVDYPILPVVKKNEICQYRELTKPEMRYYQQIAFEAFTLLVKEEAMAEYGGGVSSTNVLVVLFVVVLVVLVVLVGGSNSNSNTLL